MSIFDHRERLGLIMDFTFYVNGVPGGLIIPNSFWCVSGDIIVNPDKKQIIYWYRGWKSVEDYEMGLPPLSRASKVYQVDQYSSPTYDEARATLTKGGPIGLELLQMFNANALATKDVPMEGGEHVSFFEHATPAS